MAFTRSSINNTKTFARDGAVSITAIPGFEIFTPSTGESSTFSLGKNWTLTTQVGNSPKLNFKYNGNSILELTSTGISALILPSLKLASNSQLPATGTYSDGDVVKSQGKLYMLVDTGNEENNPN